MHYVGLERIISLHFSLDSEVPPAHPFRSAPPRVVVRDLTWLADSEGSVDIRFIMNETC